MSKNYILYGALLSLFTSACIASTKIQINIHPDKVITSSFMGGGVQISAYPHADSPNAEWGMLMTDKKWDTVFYRLDFMKPGIVRVLDQANWRYLKGFDLNGEPILDFHSTEVKALEKILDYCQKNNIAVLLGEWGCPYHVHDHWLGLKGKFTGANDPRWINMIVQFLNYLINDKGYTCIKYYNLVNEPNGDWASTNGNWDEWSEGVRLLKSRLEQAGLANQICIAGPDAVAHYNNPKSKYSGVEWVSESVNQLNDCIGLYDIHAYPGYVQVRDGDFSQFYGKIADLARKTGKPIIFGELGFNRDTPENQTRVKKDMYASEDSQMAVYDYSYGIDMANALIRIMNSGYSSAIAWSLDDAMHTNDDRGNKYQLKRWGFWNILGSELCNHPADEKIRPWFYTWSLMSRYFPSGISIIQTIPDDIDNVRVVAGFKDSQYSIALVNLSSATKKIDLRIHGIKDKKKFKKYIYCEAARLVDKDDFPLASDRIIFSKTKSLSVNIPANSFILYTTFDF